MTPSSHLFSCDWGTTSFRLRLVATASREVIEEVREEAGVKVIRAGLGGRADPEARAAAFSTFLSQRVDALCERSKIGRAGIPVIVSGMASSSVGWHELPYARTPFPLDGSSVVVSQVSMPGPAGGPHHAWLVSGVRSPTDIMRGEECEILGIFAAGAEASLARGSVMILPGTHSKHALLRDGVLEDFQTYMTGELCDVLASHSLLSVSVRWPLDERSAGESQWGAFDEGVDLVRRQGLARSLFRVRTRTVLDAVETNINGWFLSGLLVGSEIRELLKGPDCFPIVLMGSPRLAVPYERAIGVMELSDRLRTLPREVVDRSAVHAHCRLLERCEALDAPRGCESAD